MFQSIKEMLGFGPATDYAQLVKDGAVILDVRSQGEFASGHIKGSINIPVDQLRNNLQKLKDKKGLDPAKEVANNQSYKTLESVNGVYNINKITANVSDFIVVLNKG